MWGLMARLLGLLAMRAILDQGVGWSPVEAPGNIPGTQPGLQCNGAVVNTPKTNKPHPNQLQNSFLLHLSGM